MITLKTKRERSTHTQIDKRSRQTRTFNRSTSLVTTYFVCICRIIDLIGQFTTELVALTCVNYCLLSSKHNS